MFRAQMLTPHACLRTVLHPPLCPPYLRDRQSRILTAWRMPFGSPNLSETWLFFEEKTVKNYHKILQFYDVVNIRPMHSLRSPTWRFWPFWSQISHTWSSQTRDSSAFDENLIRNRSINDQESDHNNDHKNRNFDFWKSRNSESKNVISSKNALRKPLGSPRRTLANSWNTGFRPPGIQDSAISKTLYCGFHWNGPPYQQPQNTVSFGL